MASLKKCFFPVIVVALLAVSCESNHWFQSESTLNNNIQNTWSRVMYYADTSEYVETWHFSEGKLTVVSTLNDGTHSGPFKDLNSADGSDTVYYSVGAYDIKTKIDEAFVTISDLGATDPEYNKKWTIVKLDGEILDIAGEYNGTGGLMEREFTKN